MKNKSIISLIIGLATISLFTACGSSNNTDAVEVMADSVYEETTEQESSTEVETEKQATEEETTIETETEQSTEENEPEGLTELGEIQEESTTDFTVTELDKFMYAQSATYPLIQVSVYMCCWHSCCF